ncbi:MAG: hypothetical protein Q8L65_03270 [Burkholderiales bacterium]|nr:hypothetical protein [Burkholderiales bacterium]MDP2399133.1 hypothetical protein [Burkholderiales bacterium]
MSNTRNSQSPDPSPVFPQEKQWDFKKRDGIYESDVTALVRRMLEDESIREDQRRAWERWRNDPEALQR